MRDRAQLTKWFDRIIAPIGLAAVVLAVVLIVVGPAALVQVDRLIALVALAVVFGLNYLLRKPRRRR